jgi:hypothetical protein
MNIDIHNDSFAAKLKPTRKIEIFRGRSRCRGRLARPAARLTSAIDDETEN